MAGLAQQRKGERVNPAKIFDQRNEFGRHHHFAVVSLPARQHFEADNCTRIKRIYWLIEGHKFAVYQGPVDFVDRIWGPEHNPADQKSD